MRSNQQRKTGFTYLELLIAMAIMSVISASLYASLHIGFKAKKSVDRSVSDVRKAHLSMELIKQDLESALPPNGIFAGEFTGTDEKDSSGNNADSVIFFACSQDYRQFDTACDIREVEYRIDEPADLDSDRPILLRLITTNLLASKAIEPVEEIICRDISSFNIRYFDGADWLDSWDSTAKEDTLPKTVEITIGITNDDDEQEDREFIRTFFIHCSNNAGEASSRAR